MSAGGHSTGITFPGTGGRHDYRVLDAALGLSGVQDLRVGLKGSVRLARIDVVTGKESA